MSKPTTSPPVRHGRCRLQIDINGTAYALRRVKGQPGGAKVWRVSRTDELGRVLSYAVARFAAGLSCTCPDHTYRGSRCKHIRALVAAGLINGRTSPSLVARALGRKGGA